MNKQITSVFYSSDLLPYKDSARTIHYPLTSGTFAGSHNTKEVRFYVRDIGGTSGISWVVVSKLPNGKMGYEVCSNVVYDSELGEQYLSFDLSAYYTQVKGDLYLALRGYQGQITFEDYDNDGVYTISGDPLIEVTGTIKLAINYSPMVNTGTQVLPTDIDKLLAALSDYLLMENGFVIIDDLSVDTSGYANGQYFYIKEQKAFYQLVSGTLTKVEIALPFDFLSTQTAYNLYQLYGNRVFTLQRYSGFLICKISYNTANYLYDFIVYEYNMQEDNDIWCYHFGTNTGGDTFESLFSSAIPNPNKIVAMQDWVADHFVDLTTTQTISGKKVFSDLNLYNSRITTNSKNYFARAGVTTNQFVTYNLPFSYGEIGNSTETLAIENLVEVSGSSGTLTSADLNKVKKPNALIVRGSDYYVLSYIGCGYITFRCLNVTPSGDNYIIRDKYISILASSGAWTYNTNSYTTYTKASVDALIQNFMQNEFQEVDTTTYPTLDDFLASTGQEGYIYLYPTGVNNDYYRYIWENNSWVNLGTTQMDLSNYYTKSESDSRYVAKTQTIAGITLANNISDSDLTDALVYMNNTTDIDYVMGE